MFQLEPTPVEGRYRSRPITKEKVEDAKEALVMRRVSRLDPLSDKLREERIVL